jgi:SNF2 family DNA or RNA helicase
MSHLHLRVESGIDWLGVGSYVAAGDDKVELARVLDAVREGSRYLDLGDGHFLRISAALREQLAGLEAARQLRQRGGTELGVALALEQLEALGADIDYGQEMRALIDKLRSARVKKATIPRALKADLRPYQKEGFAWLSTLAAWGIGGVLADDMGLGKTVQMLALLLTRKPKGQALVVAPTSVCANWLQEISRFAPNLEACEITDPSSLTADVVIASYGWLARNQERLKDRRFATAVFDEAQALKNPTAQRTLAAREVTAELKLALSGTPIENRLSELWSLFRVVAPGLLGSEETFRTRFALPIEQRQDVFARQALGSIISPFILRRKKEVVARDLPEKTIIDQRVELSEGEMTLYDTLRIAKIEAMRSDRNPLTAQQQRIRLLAALTELRLAANHPRFALNGTKLASSKLEALLRLVEGFRENGHRALVFSQFPSFLSDVTAALTKAGVSFQYLDGATPKAERQTRIAAFEAGHGEVFVLSLLAGGTGINLTSASYVVILDPWWNPAVEDQAIGRSHRIGQASPVTVYRLFSQGTIEEKIIAMQVGKRALAEAVLENASSAPKSVSADQLLQLLTSQ